MVSGELPTTDQAAFGGLVGYVLHFASSTAISDNQMLSDGSSMVEIKLKQRQGKQ